MLDSARRVDEPLVAGQVGAIEGDDQPPELVVEGGADGDGAVGRLEDLKGRGERVEVAGPEGSVPLAR